MIGPILSACAYSGPIVLFGEKGSGKTTFFRYLYRALSASTIASQRPDTVPLPVLLFRVSEFEVWSNGEIDVSRTKRNLERARIRLIDVAREAAGVVCVLIDGLNRTGPLRVQLVAELLQAARDFDQVRVVLSAENALDLQILYRHCAIDIQNQFKLNPMDIEDDQIPELVRRFTVFLGI